jgi:hypothetical protein
MNNLTFIYVKLSKNIILGSIFWNIFYIILNTNYKESEVRISN